MSNVIQGLGHSWAPIEEISMEDCCQTTAGSIGVIPEWIPLLLGTTIENCVQEEDSKLEQMIYTWQLLNKSKKK